MKLFSKKKIKEYTIIVGCGRLGANLANDLSNAGEDVLIIDEKSSSFRRLSSNFGGLSLVGNGTDLDKLRESKIEKASAVVAVTNDDNTNIMIAQLARDMFKVKNVIARLHDSESESVYKELGISTICPSVLSAKEIDKLLVNKHEEEMLHYEEEQ